MKNINLRPPFPPIKRLDIPINRLHTREKPKGAEAMTIAAGFRCRDGVLLCADTEITVGSLSKEYQSKLFTINAKADSYLVYAGCVDFADELVEKLQEAVKGKTGEKLLTSARTIYRHFWNQYYTQPPKSEKTWAYILLTARESGKIVLWQASGRHTHMVQKYQSFGIGKEAGEILFRPFYRPCPFGKPA